MPVKATTAERFWSKVRFTDTCWLWRGAKTSRGYGNFMLRKKPGRWVKAHRFSYAFVHRGRIPKLPLDHICCRSLCVRPEHLEPVTQRENIRRGRGHGKEIVCPYGHLYDEENTYRHKGKRYCRKCKCNSSREIRRRAKREALKAT